MMTTVVRSVSIAVAAFLGGTACAIFLSNKLESRAWQEFETFRDTPRIEAVHQVRWLISTIEAARRGDTDFLIRQNCAALSITTRLLAPGAADTPGRRQDIEQLMERSRELTSTLQSQGMCSPKPS
jgi:hypothetical protein